MQAGSSETGPSAIRVRHILYSPNDTPQPTTPSPGRRTRPGPRPEPEAKATWEKLKADPSQFDSIARAESDEDRPRPPAASCRTSPPTTSSTQAFADAIFKPGLQPGQLLDPVKTEFGWHVIQVMHGPTDAEWADKLTADIDAGTLPFADAARDNSDNAEAAQGGYIGWIGKGQVDEAKEAAIFAAPIGKVSEPFVVPDEGIYLFLVSKEETREPDAEQRATLESSAFPLWYSQQKAGFDITRDAAITGAAS